jgi:hypothetical protein
MAKKESFYKSLKELTGCEWGCIRFPDGVTQIGRWSGRFRNFTARRAKTPEETVLNVKEYVLQNTSNPDMVPKKGWKSWKVGEVIVTIW